MKKLLLGIFTIISGLAFAQEIKIYNGPNSNVDISGTTITLESNSNYEPYLYVHHDQNGEVPLRIRRVQNIAPAAPFAEQLCWGSNFDIGDCYDLDIANPTWNSPLKTVTPTDPGMLEPKLHFNGYTGHVNQTYYILNENDQILDSVMIIFTNPLSTSKIENKASGLNINVYPNPAVDYVTISANNSQEYFVKVTDVLGNTVIEDRFSSTKKLDVNHLKNGVYIISVFNNKQIVNTKRIVVKH